MGELKSDSSRLIVDCEWICKHKHKQSNHHSSHRDPTKKNRRRGVRFQKNNLKFKVWKRKSMDMDLAGESAEQLRNKRAKRSSQIENKNLQEFFGDFQPEKSRREKRKLKLKLHGGVAVLRTAYDENGRLRVNELDICDCMNASCPGCFFPCPNCKCSKCGPTCRVNRRHAYQCIEIDGQKTVIQFKYKQY